MSASPAVVSGRVIAAATDSDLPAGTGAVLWRRSGNGANYRDTPGVSRNKYAAEDTLPPCGIPKMEKKVPALSAWPERR